MSDLGGNPEKGFLGMCHIKSDILTDISILVRSIGQHNRVRWRDSRVNPDIKSNFIHMGLVVSGGHLCVDCGDQVTFRGQAGANLNLVSFSVPFI